MECDKLDSGIGMESSSCCLEVDLEVNSIQKDLDSHRYCTTTQHKLDPVQSNTKYPEENSIYSSKSGRSSIDSRNSDILLIPKLSNDKLTYTDYSMDIINTLFEDEKIPLQYIRTDQVDVRNKLVKTIKCFAKHHKLQVTTVHLAVVLLDIYMNDYILTDCPDHQKFVAIVTLLLAAKSEDLEAKVPSIKDILHICDLTSEIGIDLRYEMNYEEEELKRGYRIYSQMYCQLEYLVFECAKFYTIRPTVVHFLQAFQNIIISEADLGDLAEPNDKRVIESLDDMRLFTNEYFRQFLSIVLENIEFNTALPSLVAAGIVATTRQLLGIKAVWPRHLQNLFRCTYEDIDQVVKILLRLKSVEESTPVKVDEDNGWGKECDSGCYVDEFMDDVEGKCDQRMSDCEEL